DEQLLRLSLLHHLGDALEDGCLVRSGCLARQLEVLVDLTLEVIGHESGQRAADGTQVFVRGAGRVDLQTTQQRSELDGGVADPALPQVSQVVGRVRRDYEGRATGAGRRQ